MVFVQPDRHWMVEEADARATWLFNINSRRAAIDAMGGSREQ